MKIRKAEEKDIPRILALLGQVLQIHAPSHPVFSLPCELLYSAIPFFFFSCFPAFLCNGKFIILQFFFSLSYNFLLTHNRWLQSVLHFLT